MVVCSLSLYALYVLHTNFSRKYFLPTAFFPEGKLYELPKKLVKEKVEKLNSADSMIFQTEKQMKEFGEKLTEDDNTQLNEVLGRLKTAHSEQNLEQIDTVMTELNEVWQKISTNLYAQTQPEATVQEGQTPSEEGAEEIQFEEVKE